MTLIEALSGFLILATVITWLPFSHWSVRGFDFPRLQILSLGLVLIICTLILWSDEWSVFRVFTFIGLVLAMADQLRMILPFTPLWKKHVKKVKQPLPEQQISVIVSNVLTPNRQYDALVNLIEKHQPDVVLTLETDTTWQQQLSVIEADYPHRVNVPLENLYGMHLYSRLVLQKTEVKYLLKDDIPSIHTEVVLRSGQVVQVYCLHPEPPSPTEASTSTLRDAELLIVGREVEARNLTTIVMGDLNDVAWSRTSRLFQKISSLKDPRIGRRFINTFHAKYPFMRWSLDHLYHSPDFELVEIKRLPHMGSDHFPVFSRLQLQPHLSAVTTSEATPEEVQEAKEKIKEGIELSKEEAVQ